MTLKFDNLTISGGIAVGKNTLMDNLRPYLEPYGWKFRSSGQIIRDYAKEYVLPLGSLAPDVLHHKIDDKVRDLLEKDKHWVIEAWLSGYLAKDFDNTLRVLLICSENSLRVDRVANRDKVTIQQAIEYIKKREEDNEKTWNRIYKFNDYWNPKHYHLIIDTYSSGQMETAGKVLDALDYDNGKIVINKK